MEKQYKSCKKKKLLIDVDGTMIQIYYIDNQEIKVYNDYEVGAVYIDSDIYLTNYDPTSVLGIKTTESKKFMRYFSIVQTSANARNCVFFLDAGDGNDFETDMLEGEDLMGWLIPKYRVDEFTPIWLQNDVSDDWSDYFGYAMWSNKNDPIIKFVID